MSRGHYIQDSFIHVHSSPKLDCIAPMFKSGRCNVLWWMWNRVYNASIFGVASMAMVWDKEVFSADISVCPRHQHHLSPGGLS